MQADCCADPGYIFPLLETNGIGQEHALFYEAYGTFLEIRREFAKAKDMYEVGLSRYIEHLPAICNSSGD